MMGVVVKNRRSLTPPTGTPVHDVHATRRGGARHEVSARVMMKPVRGGGPTLEGWALNVSRGGVRVILEEKVELGAEFEVTIGIEQSSQPYVGRIVWVQEEPDGVIAGVEFRGISGTHDSMPPPPAKGAAVEEALDDKDDDEDAD
jgi:hypothetical protein